MLKGKRKKKKKIDDNMRRVYTPLAQPSNSNKEVPEDGHMISEEAMCNNYSYFYSQVTKIGHPKERTYAEFLQLIYVYVVMECI